MDELYMSRALMRLYRRWVETGRPAGVAKPTEKTDRKEGIGQKQKGTA